MGLDDVGSRGKQNLRVEQLRKQLFSADIILKTESIFSSCKLFVWGLGICEVGHQKSAKHDAVFYPCPDIQNTLQFRAEIIAPNWGQGAEQGEG